MLHSPIHQSFSTPSQRLEAAARRERMDRMADAARRHLTKPREIFANIEPPTDAAPPIPPEMIHEAWNILYGLKPTFGQVETIQRAVLVEYPHLTMNDLKSARREARVVRPRQIAMYLCKLLTPRSLPDIGRRFGGRDHTTVIHAVRKVTALIESDPQVAAEVERIRGTVAEMSA